MPITSAKNPRLQEIRKAAATGRPTSDGLVVVEGPHLLGEALRGRWGIERILITEPARLRYADLLGAARATPTEVSERALAATATTEADQGVIALLRPFTWKWNDVFSGEGPLLALDGVQDPGNAGTILRSAEAFAASGVVFLRGSVHVANGKLLRAAAGSAFRIPILENVTPSDLIRNIEERGMSLYALSARGRKTVCEVNLIESSALILGSEGTGISELLERSATTVRIPVQAVESLNVGIAASITLFEAARQRGAL